MGYPRRLFTPISIMYLIDSHSQAGSTRVPLISCQNLMAMMMTTNMTRMMMMMMIDGKAWGRPAGKDTQSRFDKPTPQCRSHPSLMVIMMMIKLILVIMMMIKLILVIMMMMKMIMMMMTTQRKTLKTVNHYNWQNGNSLRKSSIHNVLGYENNASERALSATLPPYTLKVVQRQQIQV